MDLFIVNPHDSTGFEDFSPIFETEMSVAFVFGPDGIAEVECGDNGLLRVRRAVIWRWSGERASQRQSNANCLFGFEAIEVLGERGQRRFLFARRPLP
jgi:hypothetical protein